MNYVLGASGLVGTAMVEQICEQNLVSVLRNEYISWSSTERLKEFLLDMKITERDTFYYCSGLTNPKGNKNQMILVNCQIPLTLLKQSVETGYRVVTFGSILENSRAQNPYINTKKLFLYEASNLTGLQNHKHFQLHTVYGIHPPKTHMLLGKILFALQSNSVLEMTSGLQLREYWHARDIASFIASNDWDNNCSQVISISSGLPIKLSELALAIFRHFAADELLSLGSLLVEPNESYNPATFKQTENAANFMREPIKGIIAYLESNLNGRSCEK